MLPGFYGRILVPLDGSEDSEQVLACVEPLAVRFGATLLLLRVTTPVDIILTGMIGTPGVMAGANPSLDPTPMMEAERKEAVWYLDNLGMHLRRKGIAVECIQEEGMPATAIIKVACQLQADLIAMASHGRRGLKRLLFGSVADAVERSAPCPVLLVRADAGCVEQVESSESKYRLRQSLRWVPQETLAS